MAKKYISNMPNVVPDSTTITECLISFGLTRQEATLYITLLTHGDMTGYEVSKETGISRSNVYASLEGLVNKGAAYLIQGEATRYTPVEMKVFLANTLAVLSEKGEYLSKNAPVRQETHEGYITIQGAENIRNKLRQMLSETEHRLYLLAPSSVVADVTAELEELIQCEKKVVLLTDGADNVLLHRLDVLMHPEADMNRRNGAVAESVLYVTETEPGEIRFITDSEHVLTGTLTGSAEDTCLYSGQKNLVSVMKEALKNKITLLKIGSSSSE